MERTYWQRQSAEQPLFPDLLWSRPETRHGAGKLLIVGGHEHDFANIAKAHQLAYQAGAGSVLSVMPDAVYKFVGGLAECDFLPSNASGGFAKDALEELLRHVLWADMVILAGDNGRNSETAIVFEQLLRKTQVPITLTRDSLELLHTTPQVMTQREHTLLVLSLSQLQRLGIAAGLTPAIRYSMTMQQLVEALHDITQTTPVSIITQHHHQTVVAHAGHISTTPAPDAETWRLAVAVEAAVWAMQQPSQLFAALTTAVLPASSKQAV